MHVVGADPWWGPEHACDGLLIGKRDNEGRAAQNPAEPSPYVNIRHITARCYLAAGWFDHGSMWWCDLIRCQEIMDVPMTV
jgi:hypothetical protein